MPSSERVKLLVTVLTYPHPSNKYQEIVCTAGVTESGEWIRLYPLPLRTLPLENKIRKWDWIEVDLFPHEVSHDNRPESRRPEWDSIRVLNHLGPERNWEARRRVIDRLQEQTLDEWRALESDGKASLGVVRPRQVIEVTSTPEAKQDWTQDQKEALNKTNLFSDRPLTLDKIPYAFHVRFVDQNGKEERLLITDWEIGALFRNCRGNAGDETAAKKVIEKYTNQVFGPNRDTRIFIGTHHRFHHFMAIGVFWPPNPDQIGLFHD